MGNKKYTLVVDTNVILFGLSDIEETSCTKLLNLIERKRVKVIFAQDTFGELIYMLKHFLRKSILSKNERLETLHYFVDLFYNSISYNTKDIEFNLSKDSEDDMFMKCAIIGKADYFISDDKQHGMHNMELQVSVVTSKDFIGIYESGI